MNCDNLILNLFTLVILIVAMGFMNSELTTAILTALLIFLAIQIQTGLLDTLINKEGKKDKLKSQGKVSQPYTVL